MRNLFILSFLGFISMSGRTQTNPVITSWLQNTIKTGTYYVKGNSTALPNNILVNCQQVRYSATQVYVNATGVPSYPTGPFQDGNPSQATSQNAIFRLPLIPTVNNGTKTPTSGGNIGIFINGVAMFDYRDGVAWNATNNALCGGPGNPACPGGMGASQAWNRDAIIAEKAGFDCAKGHPAMGNYHHHQNPSAFDLDLKVISDVCNLYDADGLYTINSSKHSPLIGFAYDGFPVYGAYGYKNTDGTGGSIRMKSGYQLRNITTRTMSPTGVAVTSGPVVSTAYPLGYFREDYEYIARPGEADYLDIHNGRFCKTPEYPNGMYCYFATVDANHNSAYPYLIGPTFYGNVTASKVASVTESTTTYAGSMSATKNEFEKLTVRIFPNPSSDLVAIQIGSLVTDPLILELVDISGKMIKKTEINAGQTNAFFDIQNVYDGIYNIRITDGKNVSSHKLIIER